MAEETLVAKQTHTRYWFAMIAMGATFSYLFYLGKEIDPIIGQAAFVFLGTIALGFGVSKATQHFKPNT